MQQNNFDDKATLVQARAWCHQASIISWGNVDPHLYCHMVSPSHNDLTHWGRVTHICVGNLTNIDSDNGLLPGRRQAIIWTNAGLLLIGPLGTNLNEILSEIRSFSFKKTNLKMSSAKWRLSRLGLNVLMEDLSNRAVFMPENVIGVNILTKAELNYVIVWSNAE